MKQDPAVAKPERVRSRKVSARRSEGRWRKRALIIRFAEQHREISILHGQWLETTAPIPATVEKLPYFSPTAAVMAWPIPGMTAAILLDAVRAESE